mmetsp:Transcript_14512/g.31565  ORF Transcript_14512/g.31565 Transcript_14512/m.31565 type:complete len:612 (+) Transcript_14512:18-1853(+)|eukprot:CAMPEP_0172548216 /NCGR_PEP_ID=MMETSP1067-20121228/17567_1 /TAXON_ID=265564 ORGANISM="Thalassiosira punctigera, Strain Tpunct2005C2" /NCGR_SAMPLE_ID=MMETSP1067 /ASSEMBLY_ACC=CAM_ASM_000444 /LENGTH=611 /DNA_ID=CAMNT_0013335411 /DNA_START=14 /DNA_END=1849 /DNA_ORIENTATION=-
MAPALILRESKRHVEYHLLSAAIEPSVGENGNGKDGNTASLAWSASKQVPETDSQTEKTNIAKAAKLNTIGIFSKFRKLCQDLFLPIGYPKSVAEGYLEYQFYDSLQGLCSYLRGVVATSAVLSAAGVGDAEATAMSAAMTWAVRDGLGMIGGLLFSYVASPHFDAHVKEFRLLADVLNDVGLTLDMALPLVLTWFSSFSLPSSIISSPMGQRVSTLSLYMPSLYLLLTSTSTLCKVACGMAAGATKGNITDHFAISGNRADCQSKESTQETLVSLVGMCCGVWIAQILAGLEKIKKDDHDIGSCINVEVDGDRSGITDSCATNSNRAIVDVQFFSWSIFIILTIIHVWANYVGMKKIRLRTLNRERAKVALQSLIEDCGLCVLEYHKKNNNCCKANHNRGSSQSSRENSSKRLLLDKASSGILSPKSVSESLWKSMCGMVLQGKVHLGIHLEDLIRRSASSKRQNSTRKWSWGQWGCENYIIFMEEDNDGDQTNKNKTKIIHSIVVVMREGANDRDELKAFLHAHILEWSVQHQSEHRSSNLLTLLSRSYETIQSLFEPSSTNGTKSEQSPKGSIEFIDLYDILGEKGWDMTRLYLGFHPHRCEWEDVSD